MLWVTWRQHRTELLVATVLLVAVCLPLLVTGLAMHAEYRSDGVAACVADPSARPACDRVVGGFVDRYSEWSNRLLWAALLPGVAGVFVGAPLLAREFETGTWRLAFTQSVPRLRWLVTRVALVGAGIAAVAATAAGVLTWWRGPLDRIGSRLEPAAFVVGAPSLVSASVFAFALGVLAGGLLRRMVAAMGVTLAVFLTVRVWMEEYARPLYRDPLVAVTDPGTQAPDPGWTVGSGLIDASGRRLSAAEEARILDAVFEGAGGALYGPDSILERYLAEHGLRHYTEYHPESSFWAFQAIEAAWFLGAAAVLLAGAAWVVRWR